MNDRIPPEDLLLQAVKERSIPAIDELLRLNVDINSEGLIGLTPLLVAAMNNDAEMIEWLIVHGADVDYHRSRPPLVGGPATALAMAAASNAVEAMETLLRHKAEVDLPYKDNGMTALMYAAEKNAKEAAERLIDAGADLEARTYGMFGGPKKTALSVAAINSAKEVVKLLLNRNVDAKPLRKARKEIPAGMVKWLKAKGVL
ncbi:MAG TPA: hypothetical protein DCO77_00395 [Nitrospiraceae bacterium]|nr:hypothetical protein [Nitrospiraceae bacterium]